jgi:hypothetical protein
VVGFYLSEAPLTQPKRRLEGQQFTKLGQKYQHMIEIYLQSLHSDKHLPQSPFTGKFFLDGNLSLWFPYSYIISPWSAAKSLKIGDAMSLKWHGYQSEVKRSKASIMIFFSISKRSELVR